MGLYRINSKAHSFSALPFSNGFLGADFEHNGIKHHLRVRNNQAQNLIGHEFCNELIIHSEIQADDIYEALEKSQSYATTLLDRLAFIIGAPVYNVEPIKGYEITPGAKEREFIQLYKDALEKIWSKTATLEEISAIFAALSKVKEDRIIRSISWFRKSLGVYDPLDRFTYIWVGLETLNPLFQKMYPDEKEVTKCINCGHERTIIGTAPLKRYFKDIIQNERLYSQAREIRQGLLHGHMDLAQITDHVLEILPDLALALRHGIIHLVGLSKDVIKNELDIEQSEPLVVIFQAKLTDLIIDEKDPDFIEPDFNLDIDIYEKDGKLVFHPTVFTELIKKGIGIASLSWDLLGKSGYPFEKTTLTLKG